MDDSALRHKVDALHRAVRSGNFFEESLAADCWKHRKLLGDEDEYRLRIHSLIWEMQDARGDFPAALATITADGCVEAATNRILQEITAGDFAPKYFPASLSAGQRTARYHLWRQRVMCLLSHGLAAFRIQLPSYRRKFADAEAFVNSCLAAAGFPSNGTRARLHFFLGQVCQRDYDLQQAASHFDQSLHYCLAKVGENLKSGGGHETERAFAVYCLGKLELKLGEIDFEQGRLRSAWRHAGAARLLLRTSSDTYLPLVSDQLSYKIERYEKSFLENGWDIARHLDDCRRACDGHIPFQLEAAVEWVKTCVYLRHFSVPSPAGDPSCLTMTQAVTAIDRVIKDAEHHRLPITRLQAILVKARTLIYAGDPREAQTLLNRERPGFERVSQPLAAEAMFIEAKILSGSGFHDQALGLFTRALESQHASLTFRISCQLHVADMLREQGRFGEVHRVLEGCKEKLQNMEHTFLQGRYEEALQKAGEASLLVFRLDRGLDIEDARKRLDCAFVLQVAARAGLRPGQLMKRWRDVQEFAKPLTRSQMKLLIEKYFSGAPGKAERVKRKRASA